MSLIVGGIFCLKHMRCQTIFADLISEIVILEKLLPQERKSNSQIEI